MVAENYNEKGRRQAYPIGDEVNGQVIQSYTAIPTRQLGTDWVTNEALSVSTSVVQITQRLVGFNRAFISVENAPVRFQLDDTPPTSSLGVLLGVGDILELDTIEEIKDIKFISQSGVTATLRVLLGNASVGVA